ncbi:glycosyltransferase family A protein [uncultured Cellulomonas sp.]|uniref:glycosyltransferase family 2 protein n=1 Tax=uncultured Cellulomonas sp. TaxID=189682 RepID=UPI0026377A68|nr:glycosyltransferase family A protein [uncultured Cellulomonas sp.]
MPQPLVSILCPTYNRGPAIRSTIASVLAQTERSWELVVMSDASSDGTDAVVADMARSDQRIRLHRTRRYGFPSGPCNEGAAVARGSVHTYLAHDDHWEPDHLAVLLRALDSGAALAYTRALRERPDGTALGVTEELGQLWHPLLQLLNVVFEPVRAAWDPAAVAAVGGWRESPDGLEDWDLWLRLADAGHRFAPVSAVTARITEDAATRKHSLPCPYDVPLARFGDAGAARRAWRALTDRRRTAGFLDAYRQDTRDLYTRLLDAGELATPSDWAVDAARIGRLIDAVVAAEGRVWESLRVGQTPDGWSLGSVVATQTQRHAVRIAVATGEHMPRLTALMADAVGPDALDGDSVLGAAARHGATA